MDAILKFETIKSYNDFNHHETLHPLISVVDLSKASPRESRRMAYGFYTVFFKEIKCGDLRYGLDYYDYEEGTLIFLAPDQVIGENNPENVYQPQGRALVFHPDLLHGTALGKHMHDYSFFSYHVKEALHLSVQERNIILDCLSKIQYELSQSIDNHSKKLIAANIELFLDYCIRFYDRQFITRDNVNKSIVVRFETLLNDYFNSDKPQLLGLPNVNYCAEQLNLSPNYFGDLIKRETGKSALEAIQYKTINLAKDKIFSTEKTVNEIAYELGYKYPQHFSRVFKQRVGYSPIEYRKLN